eukprot:5189822-Pleurochrysis_carterae.AAC.1
MQRFGLGQLRADGRARACVPLPARAAAVSRAGRSPPSGSTAAAAPSPAHAAKGRRREGGGDNLK